MAESLGAPYACPNSHQYSSVSASHSFIHQGNVYNYILPESQRQEPDEIAQYELCLSLAPAIDPSYFVGRDAELKQMNQALQPGGTAIEQRRLVLGGMGGIGKTQLAIAYVRLYHATYVSMFWLNASTDLTLKKSFRLIAQRLLKAEDLEKLEGEQLILQVHRWLCNTRNTQWLLIFDNYDDPDQFNINNYIPNTKQGSVIITTRLPDHIKGQQVRVKPIGDLKESLKILQTRSERGDVENGKSWPTYTIFNDK
jgi:hypothetical protein